MTHEQALNSTVLRLKALRDITKETGTITTRAQNYILRQLPDDVLIEVAYRLKQLEEPTPLASALSGEVSDAR